MHSDVVQVSLKSQKLRTRRIAFGPMWTPRSALQLRRSQACVNCSVPADSATSGTLLPRRCACKWFLGASQHHTDALEASATKCRESRKMSGLPFPKIFWNLKSSFIAPVHENADKRISYVF